jgi:hypothetical protein
MRAGDYVAPGDKEREAGGGGEEESKLGSAQYSISDAD